MGVGGGIFLVAVGAILVFAVKLDAGWLDLDVVGWVFILSGLTVLGLTLWFWQDRRRRRAPTVVEEARLAHDRGSVPPDPPDAVIPNPPPGP